MERLICQTHVKAVPIRIGVHSNGPNAHLPAGPDDAYGDFAAIGNQYFFYGYCHFLSPKIRRHDAKTNHRNHGVFSEFSVASYLPLSFHISFKAALQRDVPMFFRGCVIHFVFQDLQGRNQARTGQRRFDNFINIAHLGGNEWRGEFLIILVDEPLSNVFRVFKCLNFIPIKDVHCALGAHNGNFRHGIGKVEIGPDMFRGHHTVRSAICFSRNDGNLGNGGLGKGVQQFGAVLDDAAEFLLGAGQKPGNIL